MSGSWPPDVGVEPAEVAVDVAAAHFTSPRAWINSVASVRPEIGKFSTARCVCGPKYASAGKRTSPIESRSVRNSVIGESLGNGGSRILHLSAIERRVTSGCASTQGRDDRAAETYRFVADGPMLANVVIVRNDAFQWRSR